MIQKKRKPEQIKGILKTVIGKLQKKSAVKKKDILAAWEQAVGEQAGQHTKPVSIRKKVLTVEVDSSTWLYELNFRKNDILRNLQRDVNKNGLEITSLRFKIGDTV